MWPMMRIAPANEAWNTIRTPAAILGVHSGRFGELPMRIDDEFACDAGVE
jgi:hypothetical protein